MIVSGSFRLEDSATVVVSNRLGAIQWQGARARAHLARKEVAWLGGEVQTLEQWIQQRWEGGNQQTLMLSPQQCEALWRQIIREDQGDLDSLGSDRLARWAIDCWRSRHVDSLPLADLVRPEFLPRVRRWQETYASALRDQDWIDPVLALQRLEDLPAYSRHTATVLDLFEPGAGEVEVLGRLSAGGWPIKTYLPARGKPLRYPQQASAQSWLGELDLAIGWLTGMLNQIPQGRAALVIPGLAARAPQVQQRIESLLRQDNWNPAAPAVVYPSLLREAPASLNAAMAALELFSGHGDFGLLSRWLRSPFFASTEADFLARSQLEVELRERPDAHLGFGSQRPVTDSLLATMAQRVPDLAALARRALEIVGQARRVQSPTAWGALWAQVLQTLGWPGFMRAHLSGAEQAWESSLQRFAALTPVLGTLARGQALAEFNAIVARPQSTRHMPAGHVIVVLERLEDLGPAYDAVWAAGLNSGFSAQSPVSNPLIRSNFGQYGRTAEQRLSEIIERVRARSGQLILSCAAEYEGQSLKSHRLLAGLPRFEGGRHWKSFGAGPRTAIEPLEEPLDRAPRLAVQDLADAAQTLRLQARSPVLAFCRYRLGARVLEPARLGLSPRQRGTVLHHALELLYAGIDTWDLSAPADRVRTRLHSVAAQAMDRALGSARWALPRLFRFEVVALSNLLGPLLRTERARRHVHGGESEATRTLRLANFRMRLRVDRIERLPDHRAAVLDFKTGTPPQPAAWLSARLEEPQLPLYAVATDAAAAVVVALRPGGARYAGFWPDAADYPGTSAVLPPGRTWAGQLQIWRRQLEQLVEEFAAGDVRILGDLSSSEHRAFAPLTRIYDLAESAAWMETEDGE